MVDIATLDYPALAELRDRIEARMTELRASSVPHLRNRFSAEAAAVGLSLDEVLGVQKKPRGRREVKADTDGQD